MERRQSDVHRTGLERNTARRARVQRPILVALLALAAAACADAGEPMAPQEPTFSAGDSRRAPQAHARNLDEEFAALAAEIPGFGGYYYEGEDLVVRLADLGQQERARTVIGRVIAAARASASSMRFVKGEYGFAQLKEWSERLPPVLAQAGVVFTDIDEARNRLTIGVENADGRARAAAKLAELAIPSAAVIVEEVEPIHFTASLRDYNRPLQGGLQIAFSYYHCTLGFNADRYDGVRGFVTNSHCTNTRGVVDPTYYYQPETWYGSWFIGTEVLDPPFFTWYQNSACPWGRQCRYSDAAFATYDAAAPWDFASVARTAWRGQYSGSLDIDPYNPRFSITSKRFTNPVGGHRMEKMGRTTGWTTGLISRTCANTNVSNSSITMLCQYFVDAGVGPGDSGSPVFYWWDPVQVTLFGILWGGNDPGTQYVFSWIGHVEQELGHLNVFQGTGGGEEPPPPPPPGECEDPSQIICEA